MMEAAGPAREDPYLPFIHGAKVERQPAGKQQRTLTLPVYRLRAITSGRGRVEVDGTGYGLAAGDVVLLAPGSTTRMHYEAVTLTSMVHFDVVYQSCRRLRTPLRDCRAPPGWPADEPLVQPPPEEVWGCRLDPGPHRGLAGTVQTICEEWHAGGADILKLQSAHHRLQGLLLRLLAAGRPAAAPGPLYQRVLHAESIAIAFRGQEFGVEQFAAAAGLSPSRFALVYRRLRGRTPGSFLAGIRLERARNLLADDGLPVGETARRVGFRSVSAFIRFFRRHTGRSPQAWRNELGDPQR
jgi:AraC-like DNA-binding protein